MQSMLPNLQTRPEVTFSPRVDGDLGRNFTPVDIARCPMVGTNCRGISMTVAIGMAYRQGSSEYSDGFGSGLGSGNTSLTQVQGPPRRR
jgi:hypothetical protein